jgi:hypothetical protein
MPLALGQLRVFRDLMTDTVTIAPYQSTSKYATEGYGAPVTYKARVVGQNRNVITIAGDEKISRVTVYLGSIPTTIGPLDRITLPARFQPMQPPILAIEHEPDEHGVHHVNVAC